MELVKVRIKGSVVTSQYGALSSGDLLTTSPDFARHLVEDCNAAEYINAAEVAEVKPAKPARAKKGK